jgi:diguanylate cyclase (GGDEF)-like protein/PAS domain S-box-containing protein
MEPGALHRWYLGSGGALLLLYVFVPPFKGSPLLISSLSGSSAIAILVGVRVHRPSVVWPWLLFAIGQALFFFGDVYTYVYPRLVGHEVPFPSIGDGLYLVMYPVLMVGVLLVARRRSPQGDRAGVLDALVAAIGVGLLSWVFLMAPYVTDATLSPIAKVVSVAYPVGDVLLLAAVLRLVFDGGRRPGSFYLLAAAVVTLLVTDAGYGYALIDGTFHHQLIYDAGWIGYYLLFGSVALHPSMSRLVDAAPDRERRLSRGRLALLTGASILAPAVEIVRKAKSGDVELLVLLSASIVLFLLVVARVAGLVRQFERAVARERTLRDANAALVVAVHPHEIHATAFDAAVSLVADAGSVRLEIEPAVGERSDGDDACLAEIPIGVPGSRHRQLVVRSPAPLSPLTTLALHTLADGVSLALASFDAVEDMHRRESEARFASLVRHASDLTTVVDAAWTIDYQSPSIERILGRLAEDLHGTPFCNLLAAGEFDRISLLLDANNQRGTASYTFECALQHADGRTLQFEMLVTDLLADEHVRGIVLNGRDISERAAFQAQLSHQAFHDPVTNLPNRALFTDRVEHALARGDRESATAAVIFLDLDDFKTVNDSLGHPAGDEVLREVARRLRELVRATDTAARFGGDEFAVLLEDVTDPEAPLDMADRIIASFERPVRVEGQDIFVRPSLGIALAGPLAAGLAVDGDELVRNADAAMYICKRAGEGGYRVFESTMHARVLERLELRAELQRAIALSQLELYFQPLIDLQTGAISGLEALCRWRHPTRGLVAPDQFIPLAEETGMIVELGRLVLFEGCRQAAAFQASFFPNSRLSLGVNLSVKQLQHPAIVADVRCALEDSGLDPRTLVLEITETVMIADAALATTRLGELRELGARIAMDDFGTGYSSLSYLSQFPIDILKMDRSFLTGFGALRASGLAAAIISLGSTLGLEVVAEGIEHRAQLSMLRALGCDTGQGYLFARPMNAHDTAAWLAGAQGNGGFDVADENLSPDAREREAA